MTERIERRGSIVEALRGNIVDDEQRVWPRAQSANGNIPRPHPGEPLKRRLEGCAAISGTGCPSFETALRASSGWGPQAGQPVLCPRLLV